MLAVDKAMALDANDVVSPKKVFMMFEELLLALVIGVLGMPPSVRLRSASAEQWFLSLRDIEAWCLRAQPDKLYHSVTVAATLPEMSQWQTVDTI